MRRITSLLVLALMLIIPAQAKKTKKIDRDGDKIFIADLLMLDLLFFLFVDLLIFLFDLLNG